MNQPVPPPFSDTWDAPPAGLLPTVIVTCSGSSDVGAVTDRAARALVKSGVGKLICLAAVASRKESALADLRGAERVVVLDGCAGSCADAILREAGVTDPLHINLAEFGLTKGQTNVSDATIVSVAARVERRLVASCKNEAPKTV